MSSPALITAFVLLADVVLVLLTTALAVAGRNSLPVFPAAPDVTGAVSGVALWLVPLWLGVFAAYGLYRPKNMGAGSLEYQSVVTATCITAGIAASVLYLTKNEVSRGFFVLEFTVGLVLLLFGRLAVRRLVQQAYRRGRLLSGVILSGDPCHIDDIARVINREPWLGFRVLGAVTPPTVKESGTPAGIPVLGHTDALGAVVKEHGAQTVICTEGSFSRTQDFRRLAWDLENEHTQMIVVPTMTDVSAERLRVRPIAGLPLIHVEQPRSEAASRWGKRLFDLAGSAALIVLSAPVMLAIAIAIKVDDRGPVFFRQMRVGRHGEPIRVYKFRSMVVDAEKRLAGLRVRNESDGVLFKMAKDPRVTRVGSFIRRYSLDELPQFFNVFAGEMSLVGPRPALPSEVEQYEAHVRRRLDVRPGITGLWQVSGRSDLSWEDTVRLDLYYVDNWSMVQDFMILLRTFRAVVASAGAY